MGRISDGWNTSQWIRNNVPSFPWIRNSIDNIWKYLRPNKDEKRKLERYGKDSFGLD